LKKTLASKRFSIKNFSFFSPREKICNMRKAHSPRKPAVWKKVVATCRLLLFRFSDTPFFFFLCFFVCQEHKFKIGYQQA
jgi:hypothetical protein